MHWQGNFKLLHILVIMWISVLWYMLGSSQTQAFHWLWEQPFSWQTRSEGTEWRSDCTRCTIYGQTQSSLLLYVLHNIWKYGGLFYMHEYLWYQFLLKHVTYTRRLENLNFTILKRLCSYIYCIYYHPMSFLMDLYVLYHDLIIHRFVSWILSLIWTYCWTRIWHAITTCARGHLSKNYEFIMK